MCASHNILFSEDFHTDVHGDVSNDLHTDARNDVRTYDDDSDFSDESDTEDQAGAVVASSIKGFDKLSSEWQGGLIAYWAAVAVITVGMVFGIWLFLRPKHNATPGPSNVSTAERNNAHPDNMDGVIFGARVEAGNQCETAQPGTNSDHTSGARPRLDLRAIAQAENTNSDNTSLRAIGRAGNTNSDNRGKDSYAI